MTEPSSEKSQPSAAKSSVDVADVIQSGAGLLLGGGWSKTVISVITNLGAVGLVCLLLWFVMTKIVPDQQRELHDVLMSDRETYKSSLAQMQSQYTGELTYMREYLASNHKRYVDQQDQMVAAQRAVADNLVKLTDEMKLLKHRTASLVAPEKTADRPGP